MKKSLFWLGAAAMALASCTNSEVMEVAENRAIGFSSFVGKPTKAVTPVTSLSDNYYVFGNYGDGTGTWNGQAFNNEINTATYYWQTGKIYRFGAYADGAGGKIETSGTGATVAFSATDKKLTFTNYTPNDSKDLVVAATADISADNYTGGGAVPLTFSHMLSQVKLTFTTDAADTYKLTITDVKINNAVSTATGTFIEGTGASWDTGTAQGYIYEDFKTTDSGSGIAISKEAPASQVKLVIPQGSTNSLTVTFTATIKSEDSGTTNFTANLTHAQSGHANTWMPGYCYNYTAYVELSKVIDNAGSKVKITFTPTVTPWEDFNVTPDLNPTEVQP